MKVELLNCHPSRQAGAEEPEAAEMATGSAEEEAEPGVVREVLP